MKLGSLIVGVSNGTKKEKNYWFIEILILVLKTGSRPACGNIALLTVESKSINAQHLHESCYQPNVKFNYSYLFSIIFN